MSIRMFSRPRLTRILPLLGSALLLSACGQDMSDLEPYIAEVKARKSRAIEPIPQVKQYEAFTYEARGRRDPFVKLEPERSDSGQVVFDRTSIAIGSRWKSSRWIPCGWWAPSS